MAIEVETPMSDFGATLSLAIGAILLSIALKFTISLGQPLWLDETWTAAIAAQPNIQALRDQIYLDANAPLYYAFMYWWTSLFGDSNIALRLPSAIFGAAVPLAVAFTGIKGLRRPERLTWAALLAMWTPGIWFSGEARCYSLLILFSTLQLLSFLRLLRRPSVARASLWCGFACLAVLTHYHAAVVAGLQGVAYLAVMRGRALRTWPAAAPLAPALGWIAYHSSRLREFADPRIAWYGKLSPGAAAHNFSYALDGKFLVIATLLIFVLSRSKEMPAWRVHTSRPQPDSPPGVRFSPLWIAVLCSGLGLTIVSGLGMIRPSFTERYVAPFAPGLLLVVALIAQDAAKRTRWPYVAVITVAATIAGFWAVSEVRTGSRSYNWQIASETLMRNRPRRLVFFWDHPEGRILTPIQLDNIGAFFFRRAKVPITINSRWIAPGDDPNPILVAAARDGAAILWVYDLSVKATAASRAPPQLSQLDPTLRCRNFGRARVGILACDRAPLR